MKKWALNPALGDLATPHEMDEWCEAHGCLPLILRTLADVDEPRGLGAVVVDSDGRLYVRHDGDMAPWYAIGARDKERPWRYFKDIEAVRILSDGVIQ